MSASDAAATTTSTIIMKEREQVSRKCPACDMNEQGGEEELHISRKPSTISNQETMDEIMDDTGSVSPSEGFPLDSSTKGFMESRFGYDFGNVRIHSGERGARSAESMNALAYTIGNDVVFREGYYQPNTFKGRRMLAHELTHVLQQTDQGGTRPIGVPVSTNPQVRIQRIVEVRPPGRGEASAFEDARS
ncbi:MAG TPA: DUF4157 domain-containing protein [Nitrososphaera sp.]